MGGGGSGKRKGGRYDSEAAGVADGAGEFRVTDPAREISQICTFGQGMGYRTIACHPERWVLWNSVSGRI